MSRPRGRQDFKDIHIGEDVPSQEKSLGKSHRPHLAGKTKQRENAVRKNARDTDKGNNFSKNRGL